jgi:hypothetical protein
MRDKRSPEHSIIFLEQNGGKHIKALRWQIAKRSELSRASASIAH